MKLGIEWAAGFFEGEGSACFSTKTGQASKRYQLTVNQVDRESLDTFCNIIGFGKVRGPYGPYKGQLNKKPIYIWKAVGREAVIVSHQLLPYLFSKGRQLAPKLKKYEEYKESVGGPINIT